MSLRIACFRYLDSTNPVAVSETVELVRVSFTSVIEEHGAFLHDVIEEILLGCKDLLGTSYGMAPDAPIDG